MMSRPGGIDDRTIADQVNQIFALVTIGAEVVLRFSQHEFAAGLAQSVFDDPYAHWAGKTDLAFGCHQITSLKVVKTLGAFGEQPLLGFVI